MYAEIRWELGCMGDAGVLQSTWSTSLREIHLGNKNYCSPTSDTKTPVLSVAEVVFPFSQYNMKLFGKKDFDYKKSLCSYCVSRKMRVTENAIGI